MKEKWLLLVPNLVFSFLYRTRNSSQLILQFEDSRHGQESALRKCQKKSNPDILFVINRTLAISGDNSSSDSVLENALIAETPAAKKW